MCCKSFVSPAVSHAGLSARGTYIAAPAIRAGQQSVSADQAVLHVSLRLLLPTDSPGRAYSIPTGTGSPKCS